jgi:starch phosphorylase
MSLRYALGIPLEDIWRAHEAAKSTLIDYINHSTNAGFERHVFTIGFARRSTGYKRPLLIFRNIERLRTIARDVGPIQILFGGKAHPNDWEGKELIRRVHEVWNDDRLKVAFVPNYDFESAKYIVSGVDLWLNNPLPPLEASGTSGMKAALNGIPSLSVLDGWWIEGWIEGVTGWSLGGWELPEHPAELDDSHADELYRKLAGTIMPIYYRDLRTFQSIMRNSIAFNGSFFNTHRLVIQYALGAYGGMKVSVQD